MLNFRSRLDDLENVILGRVGQIPAGGDFSARTLEWGMPHRDSRGNGIFEMAAKIGLVVLNTESFIPTFRRPGCERSIFGGGAFTLESLVSLVNAWRVLEDFSSIHCILSG